MVGLLSTAIRILHKTNAEFIFSNRLIVKKPLRRNKGACNKII
jgi:hypothetical protein